MRPDLLQFVGVLDYNGYLIYGCPELLRCMTGTSGLLLEEIGMRPRADQVQFTSFYAINQKPVVRFDMDLPVTLPNPA